MSGSELLTGQEFELDTGILSLCVFSGVINFASEKFTKQPDVSKKVANDFSTLVWWARQIMKDDSSLSDGHPGILMLRLLLTHGADPNSTFNDTTEWRVILEDSMIDSISHVEDVRLRSFEAIKLLLRHGAHFEQLCSIGTRSTSGELVQGKASDLLRKWYDADRFAILEDIVKRRETKKKKKLGISKKMGHLKLWVTSKR